MKYFSKINLLIKKNNIIFCFLLCSLAVFVIGLMLVPSTEKYVYDSEYYYHLATSFFKNGSFKFTNFDLSFRGYLFPFILFIYIGTGSLLGLDPAVCILIGNSLYVSFLFVIIIPKFFQNTKKRTIVKTIIPLILFMIYWSDLIYYPLSDLYSYGTLLIAIWLITVIDLKYIKKSILIGLLSGAFLYASYNTRTIYIFSIPFAFLLYVFIHRKDNYKKIIVTLLSICLGLFICTIPQIIINDYNHNKKTMVVITDSLFDYQLYMGLYLQRYETYIGDPMEYPSVGMNFIDGVGNHIIAAEQLTYDESFSIIEYIKLVLKYPIDYMGIMARHFINIFHLPYNKIYINNLNFHKTFFTILNYTIVFIAGIGLVILKKKKRMELLENKKLYLLISIIPCLAILLGAIEMRFFIPIYILIYSFISYEISIKEMVIYIGNNRIKIALSYIIIFVFLAAIWGSTLNNAQLNPQFLG